jgi:hypothetical protein
MEQHDDSGGANAPDDSDAGGSGATGRPDVERRADDEGTDSRSDAPAAEGTDVPGTDAPDRGENRRDGPVGAIESKVDRAREADGDASRELLFAAREDLDALIDARAGSLSASEESIERLDRRIDRLLAAEEESGEYGAGLGASMNPEDEDAP